ncbi:hypothetical protein WA577_001434 [Blastocystis sp. JDR]
MTLNQIGVQADSPLCWSPDGQFLFYVNGTHGISVCQSDANNHFTRISVLQGHKRRIRQMQCHPSKPILVSCGDEGIFVWDLNTHACIKKITEDTCPDAHEEDVECMIWLYDGIVLATGGSDSTVKLWDVERDFSILETINAHKSNVSTLAFCASQDYLVTAGRDSSINLWSTRTLRPEVLAKRYDDKSIVCLLIASMDGHLGDVSALTLSSDGGVIFSGARDNTIRAWDFKKHSMIREIKDQNNLASSHKGDVTSLYCINNDQFLVSTSFDGTMHIYKLGAMTSEEKMDGNLTLASLDELLKGVAETETEGDRVVANDVLISSFPFFANDSVMCSAMNPKVPLMAIASDNNCVRVYDISKDIRVPQLTQEFVGHSDCVNKVVANAQGLVVSASTDFDVSVFNPQQATRLRCFNTGAAMFAVATCNDIVFAAGKDYVIHCYSLNAARFYQAMEQQCFVMRTVPHPTAYDLYHLTGHVGKVRSLAFCPDLKLLASASEDGTVAIHTVPELSPVDPSHPGSPSEEAPEKVLEDHNGIVLDVAVSDEVDGKHYLASVGNDYALFVYTLGKHTRLAWSDSAAHRGVVTCVMFGHGAARELVFTGGWDKEVHVWNVSTGEQVKTLTHHTESITGLTVSADGRYLVSAAADKSLILWDISEDFAIVARYVCPDECKSVCIAGDEIVAGYASGVIRLWPFPGEEKKDMFVEEEF